MLLLERIKSFLQFGKLFSDQSFFLNYNIIVQLSDTVKRNKIIVKEPCSRQWRTVFYFFLPY
ncbi:hypothetical protein Fmac_009314 [Flemingia macrophylla]|uniref:Uncharacterized protein n=1 Tax=Flemingia macrophylla TaxID=520843 RepID=A0ABD1MZW5_9FABA